MSIIAGFRQALYPREFRIDPLPNPDIEPILQELDARLRAGRLAGEIPPDTEWDAVWADVGTGLWRLRQKLLPPGKDQPGSEMRRAYRHLESVWDVLSQAGMEIIDHTGVLYDSGMSLTVIAFQPVPGYSREKVLETVKPTIYLRARPIQTGEVIVGTPG